MERDNELDREGIPDLEGPLPEKAITGDPQEGVAPPADEPASLDYGITPAEQRRPEPLDLRLSREQRDLTRTRPRLDRSVGPLVPPEDDEWATGGLDEEPQLVADEQPAEGVLAPEEAAMHEERG
jgi:hypothetical protein